MGNRRAPNKRDKSSGNSLQSYEKFSVRNRERRTRSGSLARRRWIELINEEDRMNCIDRTKTAGILLAVIACIVFASGRASAQAAQGLAAVGAVDPANGYPKWYQDKNGLQLTACLDNTTPDPLLGGADLCGLVAGGAIPAGPVVFPTNFPDEFF